MERLTSEEHQVLPELAILVILEVVLQNAITALHSAYPELTEEEPNPLPYSKLTPPAVAAEALINLAGAMQEAIDLYRRVTYHLAHYVPRETSVATDLL